MENMENHECWSCPDSFGQCDMCQLLQLIQNQDLDKPVFVIEISAILAWILAMFLIGGELA